MRPLVCRVRTRTGRRWQVTDSLGESTIFVTWGAAMEYADELARTRQVVLSRGPYEARSEQYPQEKPTVMELGPRWWGNRQIALKYTEKGHPREVHLAFDEARQVALGLLALTEAPEWM